MAITHGIKETMLGFGNPTAYAKLEAQNVPINAATTFTLNSATVNAFFLNTINSGKVRIRFTALGAGGQVTALKVTVTDGTTTEVIGILGTFAVNDLPNIEFDFVTDLSVNAVSIIATLANLGTAGTADVELSGN
jgi:hypothetical protein